MEYIPNKSREAYEVSEESFWEQFRYDPDYPDTCTVTDYRKLAWFKEVGNYPGLGRD